MTDCEQLSDRMPAVALGGQWTAPESRHLVECDECGAEWRLVQTAVGLGRTITLRETPGALAGRIVARVAADRLRARTRRTWMRVAVSMAAAAAVVLGVRSTVGHGGGPRPEGSHPDTLASAAAAGSGAAARRFRLSELDQLGTAELQTVLDGLDAPLTDGSTLEPIGMGDLNDQELERVLRSWEG